MRGNPRFRRPGRRPMRSIPAYAGEPGRPSPIWMDTRVYPRVCGGTLYVVFVLMFRSGLSPRMRGNPVCGRRRQLRERSIPAYAGEPTGAVGWERFQGVYPRVCGGTSRKCCVCPVNRGLSPRMRGNPSPAPFYKRKMRSIPAYAGEPYPAPPSTTTRWVYPRVCGGTWSGKRVCT